MREDEGSRAPGKDLYVSPLFRALRAYAETSADEWYILSAEHGLMHPETVIAPYERTLIKMRSAARHEWADRVSIALAPIVQAGDEVIMLAGERYREGVLPWLSARGVRVTIPLQGLMMGQQLFREMLTPEFVEIEAVSRGPYSRGTYRWRATGCAWRGQQVTLAQIPHLSRANSKPKLDECAEWLTGLLP